MKIDLAQLARTGNPDRKQALGRCHTCDLGFAWPASGVSLLDMHCPRCGDVLEQTTRRWRVEFYLLSRDDRNAIVAFTDHGRYCEGLVEARRVFRLAHADYDQAYHAYWKAYNRRRDELGPEYPVAKSNGYRSLTAEDRAALDAYYAEQNRAEQQARAEVDQSETGERFRRLQDAKNQAWDNYQTLRVQARREEFGR